MSLIEVAIALLIISLSIPSIINLQIRLNRSVFNSYSSMEQIILMKNLYYTVSSQELYKEKKPYNEIVGFPPKSLQYISNKYENYDNLLLEKITINEGSEELVSFRFYPEPLPNQASSQANGPIPKSSKQ